jgi:hypothetical protein
MANQKDDRFAGYDSIQDDPTKLTLEDVGKRTDARVDLGRCAIVAGRALTEARTLAVECGRKRPH